MYTLNIEDDQGHKMEVPFGAGMLTLGRDATNNVRLDERNVSRKHARINAQNGTVYLEDCGSQNGIRINGERITGKVALFLNDRIQVGDFVLHVQGETLKHRPEEITQKTQVPKTATSEEVTNTQAMPAPAAPAVEEPSEEEEDHESTAIIRVSANGTRTPVGPAAQITGPNPKLVCVKGPLAGKEWLVSKTEMIIGRDDDNDIPIPHRSISRQHAKLVMEAGRYRVVDMKSANGTLVNGEEYAQSEVKRGDVIELGHVKLRLVFPGETMPAIDRGGDEEEEDESTEIKFVAKRKAEAKVPRGIWIAVGAGVLVAIIVIAAILISKEEPAKPQVVAQPLAAAPNPLPPAATPPPPTADQPSVQAFLEKAQAQSQQERWEDALETLRAGLLAHDKDPQLEQARDKANMERGSKATFDAAEAAAERGDVNTARELYGQIAESSHYYARAMKRLAELKSIKEPRTAQKPSPKQKGKPEVASKPEPSSPPPAAAQTPREQSTALVKQANDAVLQNRIKDAIELYQEAAHADPKNPAPHRGLGIAQARAGNGAASIEQYRIYLQLAPTAGDANQVRKIIHDFESGGEE